MREAKRQNLFFTMVLWSVFGAVSMVLMLWASSNKPIVITDMTKNQTGTFNIPEGGGMTAEEALPESNLQFRETQDAKDCFWIPLPEGLHPENVYMENRYMDSELWLYIENAETSFFEENAIYGAISRIENGFCEMQRGEVIIKLQMNEVLEYYSTMESNLLQIRFDRPEDVYEQIVVIDPVGGGDEIGIVSGGIMEKNLALQVAKYLQKKELSSDIRLYFTRLEDVEVPKEKRLRLAQAVGADMFIRIGVYEAWDNLEKYGIQSFYNENYYIPDFGNVELADIVTRNVTISSNNRALGLFSAEPDSILYELKVPAAEICLGYLSNSRERELLSQEDYQEKLAEGIANAIMEAFAGKED